MSNFEDAVIQRIKQLEREVERLQKWERPIVITDHGNLAGLADDDHPQYLLTTGKAADSDKLDGIDSTAFVQASDLGVWSSWTPTVAYTGGTTDPTSFTVTARYTRIGKLVVCVITGTLVRGSGNHAYINFTPPVSIKVDSTGSATHSFSTGFQVAPCYTQSGKLVVNTGTWTKDGYLWSTWIYETS